MRFTFYWSKPHKGDDRLLSLDNEHMAANYVDSLRQRYSDIKRHHIRVRVEQATVTGRIESTDMSLQDFERKLALRLYAPHPSV